MSGQPDLNAELNASAAELRTGKCPNCGGPTTPVESDDPAFRKSRCDVCEVDWGFQRRA